MHIIFLLGILLSLTFVGNITFLKLCKQYNLFLLNRKTKLSPYCYSRKEAETLGCGSGGSTFTNSNHPLAEMSLVLSQALLWEEADGGFEFLAY